MLINGAISIRQNALDLLQVYSIDELLILLLLIPKKCILQLGV